MPRLFRWLAKFSTSVYHTSLSCFEYKNNWGAKQSWSFKFSKGCWCLQLPCDFVRLLAPNNSPSLWRFSWNIKSLLNSYSDWIRKRKNYRNIEIIFWVFSLYSKSIFVTWTNHRTVRNNVISHDTRKLNGLRFPYIAVIALYSATTWQSPGAESNITARIWNWNFCLPVVESEILS